MAGNHMNTVNQTSPSLAPQTPPQPTPGSHNCTDLQLRHPRIASNLENDETVESAVRRIAYHNITQAAINTQAAVNAQVTTGRRLHFQELHRGDIMFLCTYHSIYGEASRKYLYWGNVSVEGQMHLIFLTLVTLGNQGVGKSPHWFLEPMSYQFQEGYYKGMNAFLSWTQAVAIKPSHQDCIVGVMPEFKATENDLEDLKAHMSHLLSCHIDLLRPFCRLQDELCFFLNEEERGCRYLEIHAALDNSEGKSCTCQFVQNLYRKFRTMTNEDYDKYFPIDLEKVQRFHAMMARQNRNATPSMSDYYPKQNDNKCRPPKDFCWCMTGDVVPFDPGIHELKSPTLDARLGF